MQYAWSGAQGIVSNKFPGDTDVADSGTTIWVLLLWTFAIENVVHRYPTSVSSENLLEMKNLRPDCQHSASNPKA